MIQQIERRNPRAEVAEDDEADDANESEAEESDDDQDSSSAEERGASESSADEMDEPPDEELRRKVATLLSSKGQNDEGDGDNDEDGDDNDEDEDEDDDKSMDDDQMMQLDDNLAEIFRARKEEKKGKKGERREFFLDLFNVLTSLKDIGAQREATHFKNRVLDLLDIFIRKQPTSKYLVLVVAPLIRALLGTSSDEKDFSEKLHGLIRNRLSKSKDIPKGANIEHTSEALEQMHTLARKTHPREHLADISICSLYLSRVLSSEGAQASVVKSYQTSLTDFLCRKTSPLHPTFLNDFSARLPNVAWTMRQEFVTKIPLAINSYRQAQAFIFIQTMIRQISMVSRLVVLLSLRLMNWFILSP